MVEYFAGKKNVSNEFKKAALHRVASFELNDSTSMDFLSEGGFVWLALHGDGVSKGASKSNLVYI